MAESWALEVWVGPIVCIEQHPNRVAALIAFYDRVESACLQPSSLPQRIAVATVDDCGHVLRRDPQHTWLRLAVHEGRGRRADASQAPDARG